jgi:hypothetical protein
MSKAAMKLALEYLEQRGLAWNIQIAMREALAEQPAQQEPVGRLESDPDEGHVFVPRIKGDWSMLGQDLYTTPPAQRKPLTINEVEQILGQHNYEIHGDRARYIVRMTEAAHGIKENT